MNIQAYSLGIGIAIITKLRNLSHHLLNNIKYVAAH